MELILATGMGQVFINVCYGINGLVDALIYLAGMLSTMIYGYYLFFALFGMIKKKSDNADDYKPVTKFAIVVAAHNEEQVIAETIKYLAEMDYPDNMYDIYVVADNCTDNTAKLARCEGAIVYERFDDQKRGKGIALEWMFSHIWGTGIEYDAICVFDADNIVHPRYLKEMNMSFSQGNRVVQGYLDCKNPYDSYIAGCYSIIFWSNNRVMQLARKQMNMSCGISGTGFCISAEVLKQLGWGAYCLTEDLEFQLRCVMNDIKVGWNHNAIVYDEKPLTMKQSLTQRTRWMQGHSDCSVRYLIPLIKKSIKERKIIPFDTCVYLIQAYAFALMTLVLSISISRLLVTGDFLSILYLFEGTGIFVLYTVLLLILEKKLKGKIFLYVFILPFYIYSWLVPVLKGWRDRKKTEWAHTLHVATAESIKRKVKR